MPSLSLPTTIAIAGSTVRTLQVAQELHTRPEFSVSWALTPAPRAIGRKKIITPNPIHIWAQAEHIPAVLVDTKIDSTVKEQILAQPKPDILLVVDFGYFIPTWLLELPAVAPINIHPSLLPRWRGSSPGQFVLLSGETESAVSVIIMNDKLDQGDLIHQAAFSVVKNWDQSKYYESSFNLISTQIAGILSTFLVTKKAIPQPLLSPTPIARRLTKEDTFIKWDILKAALQKPLPHKTTISIPETIESQPVMQVVIDSHPAFMHPTIIDHACRAFSPWPHLWTSAPTTQGEKRVQILECTLGTENTLELSVVKIEGKSAKSWHEVKNLFLL